MDSTEILGIILLYIIPAIIFILGLFYIKNILLIIISLTWLGTSFSIQYYKDSS